MKRIRIAHASGRDWKEGLLKYLAVHLSTPNATTGASPPELLYPRKFRTKLPELDSLAPDDLEARDKDCEKKGKGNVYADMKRQACENDMKVGDSILVKQEKENKFSTTFHPRPFMLVQKNGNSVHIDSDTSNIYKRNMTEVKLFHKRSGVNYPFSRYEPDLQIPDNDEVPPPPNIGQPEQPAQTQDEASNASHTNTDMIGSPRPVRTKRIPEKLNYVRLCTYW